MVSSSISSHAIPVEFVRSLLFVPGDRSDRFDKAAASGADLVVCDLEDSVRTDAKDAARDNVTQWLSRGGMAAVRVNGAASPWHESECEALEGLNGLVAVIVPKSEDPQALATVHERLGGDVPLIALIETALGLHRAYQLATTPGVSRLAFGALDFALDIEADIEADGDELALLHARSTLVVASRAAARAQPIDGVTLSLDDPTRASTDAASARKLGFTGKLCIHPRQISAVNAAFTPTAASVDHARRVVQAADDGAAARLDGQMVDAPVLERACRVLRQAHRWSASSGMDRS